MEKVKTNVFMPSLVSSPPVLRDIQRDAVKLLRLSFRDGNRRIICHMGTGTGKTILAGFITESLLTKKPNSQVIFIAPRIKLQQQTAKVFADKFGFNCGVIQSSKKQNLHRNVQVAVINTLESDVVDNEKYTLSPDLIFIDEAHIKREKLLELVERLGCPKVIGLSATPFSAGLGDFYTDMVRPATMRQAISDGILCNYSVSCGASKISRDQLVKSKSSESGYTDSSVAKAVKGIVCGVVSSFINNPDAKGRRFIVFCQTKKSCEEVSGEFKGAGFNAPSLHSGLSSTAQKKIYSDLECGNIDGVVSVFMLCEGFDDPKVSMIINLVPYAAEANRKYVPSAAARYIQSAGRGLRRKPDGFEFQDCIVHDHTHSFSVFGAYELIENHFPALSLSSDDDDDGDDDEGDNRKTNDLDKGALFFETPISGQRVIDGVMMPFYDSRSFNQPSDRQEELDTMLDMSRQLKHIAMRMTTPKKQGWHGHKFKELFGEWPGRGVMDYDSVEPTEPDAELVAAINEAKKQWIEIQNA